jgi:DNA (cytosine-5)-methyltransferase 1
MCKPKLLDLYCGAGGAAMGYARAGFEVVGVDIDPQPNYPFAFHRSDAIEYLRRSHFEYDVIHASPPCQGYTRFRQVTIARYGHVKRQHPDLVAPTRAALIATGKPYVIENVQNSPLHTQFILCGKSLGLKHIVRHRHFESNVLFLNVPRCTHRHSDTMTIGVYGDRPDGRRLSHKDANKFSRAANSIEEAQRIMGIDWMTWDEIREAIPPVYTEWIGRYLVKFALSPNKASRRRCAERPA